MLLLFWAPPLLLAGIRFSVPVLPTGAVNYGFYEGCRDALWFLALIYIPIALVVRFIFWRRRKRAITQQRGFAVIAHTPQDRDTDFH
jgi:hypothetical protein